MQLDWGHMAHLGLLTAHGVTVLVAVSWLVACTVAGRARILPAWLPLRKLLHIGERRLERAASRPPPRRPRSCWQRALRLTGLLAPPRRDGAAVPGLLAAVPSGGGGPRRPAALRLGAAPGCGVLWGCGGGDGAGSGAGGKPHGGAETEGPQVIPDSWL